MTGVSSPDSASPYTFECVAPLDLSAVDIQAWHNLMAQTPALQRAFFAPEFAQSTQRALAQTGGQASVLIVRQGGIAVAFFPHQFASNWHMRLGSAERVGEPLSDHTGLVAGPDFRISPSELLRAAGLSELYLHHVPEYQASFGLVAEDYLTGHAIDLTKGPEAYFAELLQTRKSFVQDTKRRMRNAEKQYPGLTFKFEPEPDHDAVRQVLKLKQEQYARTGVGDMFLNDPRAMAVIDALLENASPACQPVVARLSTDDYSLAWHLGLLSNGVLSYWFPVYDVDARKLSPGRLLLWMTINAADSLGISYIDRGEGDTPAKRDFSNQVQAFGKLAVHGRGAKALVARGIRSLSWRLK